MLFWNSCAKDEAIGSGSQNKHCATQPVFYWGLILLWGLYNQSKYLLLLYLFFSLVLREKKYSSATLHLLLNLLNKLLHHFNWFSQHLGFYWVAFCLVLFSKPHLPQSHKNFFFYCFPILCKFMDPRAISSEQNYLAGKTKTHLLSWKHSPWHYFGQPVTFLSMPLK